MHLVNIQGSCKLILSSWKVINVFSVTAIEMSFQNTVCNCFCHIFSRFFQIMQEKSHKYLLKYRLLLNIFPFSQHINTQSTVVLVFFITLFAELHSPNSGGSNFPKIPKKGLEICWQKDGNAQEGGLITHTCQTSVSWRNSVWTVMPLVTSMWNHCSPSYNHTCQHHFSLWPK